tara:strand:- start:275 stop:502 length:228 start_codon:yes stop_codon:yes gene_type:complete
MSRDDKQTSLFNSIVSFLGDFLKDVASSMLVVILTFCLATLVSAGLLWLYEWPLILSPVGGFVVLGVMLALRYDS